LVLAECVAPVTAWHLYVKLDGGKGEGLSGKLQFWLE
jgi:hypothetical protein